MASREAVGIQQTRVKEAIDAELTELLAKVGLDLVEPDVAYGDPRSDDLFRQLNTVRAVSAAVTLITKKGR